MLVRKRSTEGCERQPQLLWDSVWVQRLDATGGYADWILAGAGDQPESLGGLRAESALHTATLLILMTDARAPDELQLAGADDDRRGWWGDSIRLDGEPEQPLGSLIWTEIERGVADEATSVRVRDHAIDALAVLIEQGAVARTEVETVLRPEQGFLGLIVRHFDYGDARIYDQRFAVVWAETRRNAPMNFGDQGVFAHAV
ncbi:MAG: phage GP46 family protein [Hyphomicrobium zavarzinii]|jgi:phage gp46-like protein|uniref:phage GP46 family protein n=1 Tax=Hyphomicrobium zavarzinii TaxID=48292 RepID=UPI001A4A896D|nr:phage GP46 family protein [Hyphomicrobium zavarzinii]MBL8844818.1 phage GP46 family protein [Hyphomicrobium zavarzinii]